MIEIEDDNSKELEEQINSLINDVLDSSIIKGTPKEELSDQDSATKNDKKTKKLSKKKIKLNQLLFLHSESLDEIILSKEGSRGLQSLLSSVNKRLIKILFNRIKKKIHYFIIAPYGNYFIQSLYYFLSLEQRVEFFFNIKANFFEIVTDSIGYFPIDAIISMVQTEEEKNVIRLILLDNMTQMHRLCLDYNCVRIIDKCLQFIDHCTFGYFIASIKKNFSEIATHKHGFRIVKRLVSIQYSSEICTLICSCFPVLIHHPYGNYMIGTAIEAWPEAVLDPIFRQFENKFVCLSMSKFSSNIVEKCITKYSKMMILCIQEFIFQNQFPLLIKNSYANYVLKTAMNSELHCSGLKQALVQMVFSSINKLNELALINKWRNLCNDKMTRFQISQEMYGIFGNNNQGLYAINI